MQQPSHNGLKSLGANDPLPADLLREIVRIYLPPAANCLLSVMDHGLRSRQYVNVVIAGKHSAPQW